MVWVYELAGEGLKNGYTATKKGGRYDAQCNTPLPRAAEKLFLRYPLVSERKSDTRERENSCWDGKRLGVWDAMAFFGGGEGGGGIPSSSCLRRAFIRMACSTKRLLPRGAELIARFTPCVFFLFFQALDGTLCGTFHQTSCSHPRSIETGDEWMGLSLIERLSSAVWFYGSEIFLGDLLELRESVA